MRKPELGIILFALLGLFASLAWVVSSQLSATANPPKARPVASISKLIPLVAGGPARSENDRASGGSELSGRVVSKVNTGRKLVALTFEGGPSSNLPRILDLLEKHDAKATFFIANGSARSRQGVVQEIVTRGSEIGGLGPATLEVEDPSVIRDSLAKSQEDIRQVLGQAPPYVRPPGGFDQALLSACRELDVSVLLWSIDSGDGGADRAKVIADRVVGAAAPGEIIRMREKGRQTSKALPSILSRLRAMRYRVVSVGDLLAAGNVP